MKNASIKTKLMLATLPSLIILIACLVFFAVAVNNTVKQSKKIYYDNLYTVSSNLNSADRDFY
ncbi:MAG: methyl-accepting chemotaxis protein, partial [Lachnospiraceae bacterium]|nr:methyl-accepting chemotaxis protein [Lachnospiraceae bacterium]